MKGYVYALINISLPNMIKVGQTTRDPEERAREISSATGVPTPFVVGYSIKVEDSQAAEQYVHERLSQKGIRITENREFFRASLQEVVRVLVEFESQASAIQLDPNDDANLNEESGSVETVIEMLLLEGMRYQDGSDGVFEDHDEAKDRYLSAIRLGSNQAKRYLGELYADDDSVVYNPKKASKLLLEAYEAGSETYSCLDALAKLYINIGQNRNAEIAYQKLFQDQPLWNVFENYQNVSRQIDANPPTMPVLPEDIENSDVDAVRTVVDKINNIRKILDNLGGFGLAMKKIALLELIPASRPLYQYFRFLSEDKIKIIEAPMLYKWFATIKQLVPSAYMASDGWPEAIPRRTLDGMRLYKSRLSKQINEWHRLDRSAD